MSVAIIDYGSGNLRSVAKAFERVAGERHKIVVTNSPEDVAEASHIVLPGVGAFADCMNGLRALPDMLSTLEEQVHQRKKPFLGICVGMQMLFEQGHEHGIHQGLGWLKGEVVKLTLEDESLKVPHMGWNDLLLKGTHRLMKGIATGSHSYFVHSYHAVCSEDSDVIATVAYGQTLTAVVGRGNIMGTQFHPEKSQETGLKLLSNFLEFQ
jgi:glutamine amidotransferase